MKILYHHRTRGRSVEGVHIRGIVDALRDMGHQVSILSFPGADPEAADAAQGGGGGVAASVARFISRHLPEWAFETLELLYNPLTWFRLSRLAREEGTPDLIYERYSLFLGVTLAWARRRGIPVIYEINDSALVERVRPLSWRRLARLIERRVFERADGLVFISTYFRDLATESYGRIAPNVVSPNATDADVFDPARFDGRRLRGQLGLEGQIVCGYVGAFVEWHGIHWFVDEVAPLLKAEPRISLLLLGDGDTFEHVRERAREEGVADRIVMPGRVAHDDVPDYIAAMDLAVLPDSNRYGSPMKIFEFMAMEVPVLAPAYGPIAEVIEDGVTGWLFAPGQRRECIARFRDVVEDLDGVAAVGKRARQAIVENRQWRNNARDLLALVDDTQSFRRRTGAAGEAEG